MSTHLGDDGIPLFSVVMAVYNAEDTIQEAVQSILNQSFKDYEIIICNDASTDNTLSIINDFNDSRIKVIEQLRNSGPGAARDRGIEIARAPWIAFIDADDAWHPSRLERVMKAISLIDFDFIFDNTMLCHHTPAGLVPWKSLHKRFAFGANSKLPRKIEIQDYICADRLLIHPIFKKSLVQNGGVKHTRRMFAEDAEFYLRLANFGARFAYLPDPLYLYRITPGSLTAKIAKDKSIMRRCLEDFSKWDNWGESEILAFNKKIEKLKKIEDYYSLTEILKKLRIFMAINFIYARPHLITTLPQKIFQQLFYQVHRIIFKGKRR